MSEAAPGLISRIQLLTQARLIGWQLAADGQWDVAERSFLEHPEQRTLSRMTHWLALQTTENIAFEALFESEENERFFFGVRVTHLAARDKSRVIERAIATNRKRNGVDATIRNIRTAVGCQSLAGTGPDYLELGVFDLWNRVKPVVVWKKGKVPGERPALVMPAELAHKAQRPDVGFPPVHERQTRPLILEAVWKRNPDGGNDYQCWIGLPVSDNEAIGGKYCLSESRYLSAASTFIA